jgi:hypothetical protein
MAIRRLLPVALILPVITLVGCRESGPRSTGYLVSPGAQRVRIAVIPFEAASSQYDTAAQVVTQELVTTLIGTGLFQVVEPGVVYQAMSQSGSRNLYGLDAETRRALQQQIGPVRVFIVGLVQEFGDVHVGPESYPSISLSARLLDAQTGDIIWAGSVSRTGADHEQLFGLGAVHSEGRVARAAVQDLIRKVDQHQLAEILSKSSAGTAPGAPPPTAPAGPARPTGNEKYFDEKATWTEASLTGLMGEVSGLTRGPVTHRLHHYDIVEATYQGSGFEIRVKLVDCRKAESALGFLKLDHPGETQGSFDGLPAFQGPSAAADPGGYRLDVAAGRFGLYVAGPSAKQADIETVARTVIAAMK